MVGSPFALVMKQVLRHPEIRPNYDNFLHNLKLPKWAGSNVCLLFRGKNERIYEYFLETWSKGLAGLYVSQT